MVEVTTLETAPNLALRDSSERVDIAVVIVSWNVKDLVTKNLESLRKTTGAVNARIIVVDNASTDGTAEMLREAQDVVLIANSSNVGFARACNQGIERGNARHVLLLNPDMHVSPDALAKTVEYLDSHPSVGVLGAKLLHEDGTTLKSVRRFPDVWSQLAILLKLPHVFSQVTSKYLYSDFDYTREQDAPTVRGSYFAISHTALEKVGKLDERYFIWFEEVDYCAETIKAGLHVRFVPSIIAHDLVGKSFAKQRRYWKQVQFSRSMSQFFWKWQPGWRAMLISLVRPVPIALSWIADKF